MSTPYQFFDWQSEPSQATPLSESNLEALEQRIVAYVNASIAAVASVVGVAVLDWSGTGYPPRSADVGAALWRGPVDPGDAAREGDMWLPLAT